MINTQGIEHLMQELYTAAGVDGVVVVMDRIEELQTDNEIAISDAFSLYRRAFQVLQDLTLEDSGTAADLIVGRLLPVCLHTSSDQDVRYELSKCRDILRAWLDQYPGPRHEEVRALVLDRLRVALSSDAVDAACFTIGSIGYRRDDIAAALHALARKYDGRSCDAALATLVGLGVPDEERATILRAIHRRARVQHSSLLLSAMYFLADPASVPVLQRWLVAMADDESDFPRELVLQALAKIADSADGDPALQDRIWNIIRKDIKEHPDSSGQMVYFNSSVAPVCESPRAVSYLLGRYAQDADEADGSAYHRYLLGLRLQECVRPRHLDGWTSHNHDNAVLSALRRDALRNSEQTGLYRDVPGDLKVAAWDLLLRLRDGHILENANDALADETSPSVRYEICEILACLRLPSMPTIVRDWVTGRYELTDPATREQGGFRGSAIDVARSVATKEAFDVLVSAGLSIRGEAYRDVADGLSDLAVALAGAGDASIAPVLLQTAQDGQEPFQRSAASVALAGLAIQHRPPDGMSGAIASLLQDTERSPYERSMLLHALDTLEPGTLSAARQESLYRWARHHDDWLGWRALEILTQRGHLQNDPELMHQRLGLARRDEQWVVDLPAKPMAWAGSILGILYRNSPMLFEQAVVSSLHDWDWGQVAQLLDQLRLYVRSSAPRFLPRPITDALVGRLLQQQSAFTSETDLFAALAELAPDRLAPAIEDDAWTAWRPEARVALADALGETKYVGLDATGRTVQLLQALAGDAQYAVRRAAYRALGRALPVMLRILCELGAQAPAADVRQRAAEGCVWLEDDEASGELARRTLDALSTDREPAVREAATRAWTERREHLWAMAYLDRVCNVTGVNVDVMDAWAYGEALVQIGNDVALHRLNRHVRDVQLPPHVRHWIGRIGKGIRRRWEKVTADWPEPWTTMEGRLDTGTGEVETPDGKRTPVSFLLWSRPPRSLDEETGSWGGIAQHMPMSGGKPLTLHFHNGEQRRIVVTSNVISNHGGGSARFNGMGPYPLQDISSRVV